MSQLLHDFTAGLRSRIEARHVPDHPTRISLPREDSNEAHDSGVLGYAEGQSFIIEYVDAAGEESSRRITVWAVQASTSGVPSLVAHCHERNAQRHFRIDRIQACIDYSGEVHRDVPAFLAESFGMSIQMASRTISPEQEELWNKTRAAIRPSAIILVALSNSDGAIHPKEIEVALGECEREAARAKLYFTETSLRSAERYLSRLYPQVRDVENATATLLQKDPQGITSLLSAAVRLIDADGRRHHAEVQMLNDLSLELIGLPLA